jgi:folate-binding protein YgfZ
MNPVLPNTGCFLCELSHLGVIRASGADVRTFLQGQLTNDINLVTPETSQISGYCNPKGRMLASFRIVQQGDDLWLMLPRDNLHDTLKRLRMFVLRSQVTLEDTSDNISCIELAGDCANNLQQQEGLLYVAIPGDRPRMQIIGDKATIQAQVSTLADKAGIIDTNAWHLLDIRAGIPTIYHATRETFVPQMANLHWIDGVNFKKGCYTGQEIVARMQYLGNLKRRMYRVHIDSDTQPQMGDDLYSASSRSGQGAGKVVTAAPAPQGGYEALVVTQISSAEADDLRLNDINGPTLNFLTLPYDTVMPT